MKETYRLSASILLLATIGKRCKNTVDATNSGTRLHSALTFFFFFFFVVSMTGRELALRKCYRPATIRVSEPVATTQCLRRSRAIFWCLFHLNLISKQSCGFANFFKTSRAKL